MHIEQFDPRRDEDKLRACYEIVVSGQSEDDPNAPAVSYGMFRGWWGYGFAGDPRQIWLATSDSGQPVGCYLLELPELDNRSNGFVQPVVGAAWRRQGIGTMLVAHAAEQAELAGRVLLMGGTRVDSPGWAFAEAIGATIGMQDARRVLDVEPQLPARIAALRAEAEGHARGYSLRSWTGITPDDLVPQACELNAAMADAPHDENFEPLTWDPDRLRRADQRVIIQGVRWYSVAAMHDATGSMAGLTQVSVDPAIDGWAFQEITAVTRKHRGHRLGLLTKVAMLEWLAEAEPQIRQIMTFNAVQNEHMIAVNEELGHRITDYFQSFELDVAAAKQLGG